MDSLSTAIEILASAARSFLYPNLLKIQRVVDTISDKFLTSCGLSFFIRDVFLNLSSEGFPNLAYNSFNAS